MSSDGRESPTCAPYRLRGDRARERSLLTGRELARVGPSAFDLAPDGSVVVLDQVNDRLATYLAPAAGRVTFRSCSTVARAMSHSEKTAPRTSSIRH